MLQRWLVPVIVENWRLVGFLCGCEDKSVVILEAAKHEVKFCQLQLCRVSSKTSRLILEQCNAKIDKALILSRAYMPLTTLQY